MSNWNKPSEAIKKFLTANGKSLQWAMALLALDVIIGRFFENQGNPEFDSQKLLAIKVLVRGAILLFVVFRLIKPRGQQDIQALMIMIVVPSSLDMNVWLSSQLVLLITLFCRWYRFTRVFGLIAIALCLSQAPGYLKFMCNSDLCGSRRGTLVSTTDSVYFLYRDLQGWPERNYILYRKVPIFPGLSLVKDVDSIYSFKDPIVGRTPEGNYIIVDDPPLYR